MIGMQYNTNLQAKGGLEVNCFPSSISSSAGVSKFKKDGNFEPISVLDPRSPSPSTSTSTLSSSLGGTNGGGNNESTANLVVGSLTGTAPLHEATPIATDANGAAVADGQKEEWAAELHGLQAGLELSQQSAEKFSLGLEDWDSILSESAAGQDQSLLKWMYSDVEDSSCSLKQLLQGGNSNEIDGTGIFGAFDQSSGLEAFAGGGSSVGTGNVLPTLTSSRLGLSGSEIPVSNSNGKFEAIPQNQNQQAQSNMFCVPNALNVSHHQQPLQFAQNLVPPLMNTPPQQQLQNAQSLNLLNSLLSSCPNQDQPQPKRQNLGIGGPLSISQIHKLPDPETLLRKQQQQLYLGLGHHQLNLVSHDPQRKPFLVPKQEVPDGNGIGGPAAAARHLQQLVYDQLYKATELILAGSFSNAQGILARLNHQLSPAVKPSQRAAFHFKDALQMLLLLPNRVSVLPKVPAPLDGIFKMGAYKMFSEVSPLIQFMNFTSNQALLEALDDRENIHIVDFDIGCGAQWSSFMQEIPKENRGTASLKITAFASPSTYHSLEISLMHENLSQFATDLGIKFELEVVNFDSFDPSTYALSSFDQSDTIAVNFPVWSIASRPTILPSLLCFIKQLNPKVMVMLDNGCERFELPPSHHLLNALQYYEVLLESLDAANMASDGASKIERFLIQPKIEGIVFGRLQYPNQMPPAANLISSTGFSTVPLSNFAETQAECVVKRTPVRGFHVEKRQSSLVLCWQHKELLSASVWKC